ncbi:hypothetical protein ABG808_11355 [Streptococcus iniae]
MARAWKYKCDVPISGILIDTLAYKFINSWGHKDKSYLYYDIMSRDFFEYLKDIDKSITFWLAPEAIDMFIKQEIFNQKQKQPTKTH